MPERDLLDEPRELPPEQMVALEEDQMVNSKGRTGDCLEIPLPAETGIPFERAKSLAQKVPRKAQKEMTRTVVQVEKQAVIAPEEMRKPEKGLSIRARMDFPGQERLEPPEEPLSPQEEQTQQWLDSDESFAPRIFWEAQHVAQFVEDRLVPEPG